MAYLFSGMDPYLEGGLWSDVHHTLASRIHMQLAPLLRPKYVARIERYVVEDINATEDMGIMYPDVGVFLHGKEEKIPTRTVEDGSTQILSPVSLSVPTLDSVKVRIPVIEIRDIAQNRLVTVIEILSPVNKREPGLKPYREKRKKLKRAKVHLLEIDLLRRGTRIIAHPKLKNAAYLVGLMRANASLMDLWIIELQGSLPTVPVPLLEEDEDIPLNLQKAIKEVYVDGGYDISINYKSPPPPPPPMVSKEEWEWIQDIVKKTQSH